MNENVTGWQVEAVLRMRIADAHNSREVRFTGRVHSWRNKADL